MRKQNLLKIGCFALAFGLFCLVSDHALAEGEVNPLAGAWNCKIGKQEGVWEFNFADGNKDGTITTKVAAFKAKQKPKDMITNFTVKSADDKQVVYETTPDPKKGPIQFVAKFSGNDAVAISQAAYPGMHALECIRQK